MPDPLRSPWTRLALMGIFLAPLALGFCLESRWLTQAGFIVLFALTDHRKQDVFPGVDQPGGNRVSALTRGC
jgi:hypothetical protein